jgi:dihydroflavonol-4-reductase
VVDKDDQDTHAYLKEGLGELKEDLKLVEVNLASEEEVKRACEGMHYVIHCSSPDPSEKSKRKSAPEPAVHAALNILNACKGTSVKRIVFTGSSSCICDYINNEDHTCDETHFVDENTLTFDYAKGKIQQEKESIAFMENLSEKETTFDIVYLHPSLMFGPPLLRGQESSLGLIINLLTSQNSKSLPTFYSGAVDVREVAKMHVEALKKGKQNERYALTNLDSKKLTDYGKLLEPTWEKYGYKILTEDMSNFVLWIGSLFESQTRFMYKCRDKKITVENNKAKRDLGFQERPIETTLNDAVQGLIALGYVDDLTQDYEEEEYEDEENNQV